MRGASHAPKRFAAGLYLLTAKRKAAELMQ